MKIGTPHSPGGHRAHDAASSSQAARTSAPREQGASGGMDNLPSRTSGEEAPAPRQKKSLPKRILNKAISCFTGAQADRTGNKAPEAPEAPKKAAEFGDLPVDLWPQIGMALRGSDTYQSVKDLTALASTSKAIREAIKGDERLAIDEPLRKIEQANSLVTATSPSLLKDENVLRALAPMVEFLSPASRSSLISAVSSPSVDPGSKARALAALGPAVAHLGAHGDELLAMARNLPAPVAVLALSGLAAGIGGLQPQQREALISDWTGRGEERDRALHLLGIVAGMPQMEPGLRDRVFDDVLGMTDEGCKARALRYLAPALPLFKPEQRDEFVSAVLAIGDDSMKATALSGIGRALGQLRTAQREDIVNVLSTLPAGRERARTLAGIGPGVDQLEEPQRRSVLVTLQGLSDEDKALALFGSRLAFEFGLDPAHDLPGLASGMSGFSTGERAEVVELALAIQQPQHRATALAGLGPVLDHLGKTDTARLLDDALQLPDPLHKGKAVSGLVAGIPHLQPAQREAVVRAALNIPSRSQRAETLAAMGPVLVHLEPGQRGRVVDAARGCDRGPEQLKAVLGLAAGKSQLNPDQLESLALAARAIRDQATQLAARISLI